MNKYLKDELKKAKEHIKKINPNEAEYEMTKLTIEEIEVLLNKKSINSDETRYKYISNIVFNEKTSSSIKTLIEAYAKLPLLETEISIDYPRLLKRNDIGNMDIINFLNTIYENITHNKNYFNIHNIKIFNHSFFLNKGKCAIYCNHYKNEKKLLLNRFFSIKDFILTTGKAVELTEQFKDIPFNNCTQIMNFYMRHKAINYLLESSNNTDVKNYLLIDLDTLIFKARVLNIFLKEEELQYFSLNQLNLLLLFIDELIAIKLSGMDNLSFDQIINFANTSSNFVNLEKIGCSYDQIIDNAESYYQKQVK